MKYHLRNLGLTPLPLFFFNFCKISVEWQILTCHIPTLFTSPSWDSSRSNRRMRLYLATGTEVKYYYKHTNNNGLITTQVSRLNLIRSPVRVTFTFRLLIKKKFIKQQSTSRWVFFTLNLWPSWLKPIQQMHLGPQTQKEWSETPASIRGEKGQLETSTIYYASKRHRSGARISQKIPPRNVLRLIWNGLIRCIIWK